MNKFTSRLMMASATIALVAALVPVAAHADDFFNNNGTDNFSPNLVLGDGAADSDSYTITGDSAVTNVNFLAGGNGLDGMGNPNPNGALIVGNAGTGVFNQGTDLSDATNSQVNVAGDLALGHQAGSQGTYNLFSGSLSVGGQLSVGGASTADNVFNQYSGSVTLTNATANGAQPDYAGVGIDTFTGKLEVGGGADHGGNDGGNGTYNLFGGSIDATGNGIEIGTSGTGTMNQSGNSTVNTYFFTLGFSGNGTYNLSSGTLNAYSEAVGYAGVGAFNQSGGSNTVATSLTIGANAAGNPPSAGPNIYTMTGGTLTTGNLVVGDGEQGTFIQSAPVAVDPLVNVNGNLVVGGAVGGNGSYTITGDDSTLNVNFAGTEGDPAPQSPNGALIVGDAGTGTFVQGGDPSEVIGSAVNVAGDLVLGHQSGSQGTFTLNNGTLTVGGAMTVGDASTGANEFIQNGGAVILSGTANGSTLYAGVDPAANPATFPGDLYIGGRDIGSSGTGTYTMNGGSLSGVSTLDIGFSGTGTFNQSGGTVSAGFIDMGDCGGCNGGNAAGFYNISGDGQLTTNDLNVGDFGHGEFTQSDATSLVTVNGTLSIANGATAQPNIANPGNYDRSGTYTLNDGTLNTQTTIVGSDGTGAFNQLGGAHNVTNNLYIGKNYNTPSGPLGSGTPDNIVFGGPALGTYTMSGGSLDVGSDTFVGDAGHGTFNITGDSSVTVSESIVIANQLGSAGSSMTIGDGTDSPTVNAAFLTVGGGDTGSLSLKSGSLTVALQTFVGGSPDGVGTVTQTGGTFETGGLLIGTITDAPQFNQTGHSNQSFKISGGSLTVDGALVIGSGAQGGAFSEGSGGTMTQSGASSVTVGTAYINNGTYNLQGGTFQSNDFLRVGDTKTGALFNQTGGDATVTNNLEIGGTYAPAPNTIAGTYNLSGGSLTVGGDVIVGVNSHGDGTFNYNVNNGNSASLIFSSEGQQLVVGDAGKGVFNEGSAGNTTDLDLNTQGVSLVIGRSVGGNGTFNLAAGSSLEDDLIVGDAGTGTFNNGGGTHTITGDLTLGNQTTGDGTYNLTAGGTTAVSATTIVGNSGTGTFLNDASTHTTNVLALAGATGSTGTYTVQNGGQFTVGTSAVGGFADIGQHGTLGKFVQNGDTSSTTIYGALDVGRFVGGTGEFDLNAGSLKVLQGFAVVGDSGTGTFNQGGGSTFNVSNGGLSIGRGESNESPNPITGTGTYNLSGTAQLTVVGGIEIGQSAGNTGTMNQTGGTVIADVETVGDGGIGKWTQSAGSNSDAGDLALGRGTGSGTYELSGTGSLTVGNALFVGLNGAGTYKQSGGTAGVTGTMALGYTSTGSGTATVSGGTLGVDSLYVDYGNMTSASSFTVSGGAVTVAGGVTVNNSGAVNGSSLTVSSGSLSASSLANNDVLNVSGGTVTAPVTNNHQFNFEGGKVVGSVQNNGAMDTSSGGTATVTGPLTNASTGTVGVTGGSTLAVGGTVLTSGAVNVGGGSTLDATGQSYTQTAGTTTVDGQIAANIATIVGGLLDGSGKITGDLSMQGGTIRPGDSGQPGTLTVTGTYEQKIQAIFETVIAGDTSSNQVGRLNVGGTATLGGTLDVTLLNGFTVANGDVFNIMNFAGSTGDFSAFSLNGNACTSAGVDMYTCSGLAAGLFFQEQFVDGDKALNLFVGTSNTSDVPEPWTWEMFAAGIAGVTLLRRRRKVVQKA